MVSGISGVGRWPDKAIREHPSQPPTWKSYAGWVLKLTRAVRTLQAVQSPPCGLFQKSERLYAVNMTPHLPKRAEMR